jgi:hypothetical protein
MPELNSKGSSAHHLGSSAIGGGKTGSREKPKKERSFPSPTWTRIPRQPRNQLGFLLYSINTPSIDALYTIF